MYSSGTCVECLLNGIPVISTDPKSFCYELFPKNLDQFDSFDNIDLPDIKPLLSAISNTHFTIGNNIDIQFLAPLIDDETNRIDTKRSGKYLIYSAKHVFKKEKYDLIMTGIKMGNPVRI